MGALGLSDHGHERETAMGPVGRSGNERLSTPSRHDFSRLIAAVPGIPEAATDDFDISASGTLGADERKLLRLVVFRELVDTPIDLLIGATRLGELRVLFDGATRRAEPASRYSVSDFATDRVFLRPVMPEDHGRLYYASLDPSNAFRWRFRGKTVPFDEFRQSLSAGVLVHFVGCSPTNNLASTYCAAYQYDDIARHCQIGVMRVDQGVEHDSAVIETLALMLNYLFETFQVRKVFAEIPEYNLSRIGEFRGVTDIEGLRKDAYWHGGRYWDEQIVSISRGNWEEFAARFFSGG